MKKAIAILMMMAVLFTATNVLADSLCYAYGQWWVRDDAGYLHPTTSKPLEWKTERLNRNFPMNVVGDVSDLCRQYNGVTVNCLGLTSTAGSNLRSVPCIDGKLSYDRNWHQDYKHATIIRKLHADVTVYINFKFYDANGDEWYCATCSDGLTGFLLARRILLFPIE